MAVNSEEMTPRERVSQCIRGRKPDKLPIVVINSNTFMCLYYRINVEDYLTKPELCAEVNIKFIKEFDVDCDIVATGYILYGAGPELGVKWEFVGSNFPGFVDVPIKSENDFDKIKVPLEPSGYFKNYLQTIKLINEAIGDTHHLKASFLGPFSLVCFLRGIEDTLIDMIMNPNFFKKCMKLCTGISVFLAKNLLSTGLRYPILNEIFLSPGMMNPDTYNTLVAPYDMEVQRRIGAGVASNSFAFMGLPNDKESQKIDLCLFEAFFGVGESIEAIKGGVSYRVQGFPFPAAISGRSLNSWDSKRILSFLNDALDYLINDQGIYPSITFASVQSDTIENACDIANKIKTVNAFRDQYKL